MSEYRCIFVFKYKPIAHFYEENNYWPPGARFTKRFKTNFILSLNLGLILVKICLILKDVLTLS